MNFRLEQAYVLGYGLADLYRSRVRARALIEKGNSGSIEPIDDETAHQLTAALADLHAVLPSPSAAVVTLSLQLTKEQLSGNKVRRSSELDEICMSLRLQ